MAESGSKKSYKQLSNQLDDIIEWFESGDHDIEEALLKYEDAMKLITEIENYLKSAENKIKKINIKFKTD